MTSDKEIEVCTEKLKKKQLNIVNNHQSQALLFATKNVFLGKS